MGKCCLLGANKKVVLYDPVTNNWTESNASGDAPLGDFPQWLSTDCRRNRDQDQPGAMLPDGKYLFMTGSAGLTEPSYLFEYDYLSDQVNQVFTPFPELNITSSSQAGC